MAMAADTMNHPVTKHQVMSKESTEADKFFKDFNEMLNSSLDTLDSSMVSLKSLDADGEVLIQKCQECKRLLQAAKNIAYKLDVSLRIAGLRKKELDIIDIKGPLNFNNTSKFVENLQRCSEIYQQFRKEYEACTKLCKEIIEEARENKEKAIRNRDTSYKIAAGVAAGLGVVATVAAGVFTGGIGVPVGIAITAALVGGGAYLLYVFKQVEKDLRIVYFHMDKLSDQISDLGRSIDERHHSAMDLLNTRPTEKITKYHDTHTFLDTDSKYPQVLFFNVSITTQITSSGVSINRLEDMGISISVPEDSVSSNVDLHIRPCLSGPFRLPPDYKSASPAYLIWYSGKIKADLLKDVTVKIYHSTYLESEEDCEDMAFFSSSSKPEYIEEKYPVYKFKEIYGTHTRFRTGEQVGEVSLRHFCFFMLGKKNNEEYKDLYAANLFTIVKSEADMTAVFYMCQLTPLHTKLCDDIICELWPGTEVRDKTTKSGYITGDEVNVEPVCREAGQEIKFDITPAKILKRDIDDIPMTWEISQLKHMYPPKLKLYVVQQDKLNSPSVKIIGLDKECFLNFIPSDPCSLNMYTSLSQLQIREERPQAHNIRLDDVDDSNLDLDDHVDVLEAVEPLTSEWRNLLIKLHIQQSKISTIEQDNPRDSQSCLSKGLMNWLQKNYNCQRHGNPSWRMLAKAVSRINCEQFEKIAKDHPKINRSYI